MYQGKGAPNEVQDALWLASLCGLVDYTTLATYADNNLGVDCGGFAANYWGIGRPSVSTPNPTGATGFKPRYIWGMFPSLRRKNPSEIQVDDAAVFFQDVKSDDPNIVAAQTSDGSYDRNSGSQAFHIGVVSTVSVVGTNLVNLEIAESSGASASSGGNGTHRIRTFTFSPDPEFEPKLLDIVGLARGHVVGANRGYKWDRHVHR